MRYAITDDSTGEVLSVVDLSPGLRASWTVPLNASLVPDPSSAAVEGGTYANGLFSPPPPTTADVDAFRDSVYQAGFADATTGKTWQLRPGTDDKTNWTAMAANAQPWALGLITANAPTFHPIPTTNETDLNYTPAQTYGLIAQRMMPAYEAVWMHARALKNQILANQPLPPTWKAGWPAFSA